MAKIKVLTLTWNAGEKLQRLKDSLMPSLSDGDRWYIRDNGSKDDTAKIIGSWQDPRIISYAYPNNLKNYSEGNNWLFDRSEAEDDDYVLLLNNDIIFQDSESLRNMTDMLDADPEIGVVGAKLNYEDRPEIIQHAGVLFHPSNVGTPFHYRAGKKEEPRDRKNRVYPMVTGAVLLTRASIYRQVRLNELLNWSWDDSYYCMAVGALGKKIVYCGETNILHSESASLKRNPVNRLFFDQNLRIFIQSWKEKIDKDLVAKYDQDIGHALYRH